MHAALPRALFCLHRRGGGGGEGSNVAIFLKNITLHTEKKKKPHLSKKLEVAMYFGMYFAALHCDLNSTCEKSKLILHLRYPSKPKANTKTRTLTRAQTHPKR